MDLPSQWAKHGRGDMATKGRHGGREEREAESSGFQPQDQSRESRLKTAMFRGHSQ